jgi:hypothetical protein
MMRPASGSPETTPALTSRAPCQPAISLAPLLHTRRQHATLKHLLRCAAPPTHSPNPTLNPANPTASHTAPLIPSPQTHAPAHAYDSAITILSLIHPRSSPLHMHTHAHTHIQGKLELMPGCTLEQSLESSLTGVLNGLRESAGSACMQVPPSKPIPRTLALRRHAPTRACVRGLRP